jgi:hemoglobin
MNSTATTQRDIQSPTDIRLLVDSFYSKAREDEWLAPIFEHAISDWEHHLPTMYQFWERLLLGSTEYAGNPFRKHINLSLENSHFTRWLEIFNQTLDEIFDGPKKKKKLKDLPITLRVVSNYEWGSHQQIKTLKL